MRGVVLWAYAVTAGTASEGMPYSDVLWYNTRTERALRGTKSYWVASTKKGGPGGLEGTINKFVELVNLHFSTNEL